MGRRRQYSQQGVLVERGQVAVLYIYVYIVQNILRSGHSYEDSVETSLLKASLVLSVSPINSLFLERVNTIELQRKSVRTSSLYRLDSNRTKSTFYIVSDTTKWTVSERYDAWGGLKVSIFNICKNIGYRCCAACLARYPILLLQQFK